jgi:hypothetical protein
LVIKSQTVETLQAPNANPQVKIESVLYYSVLAASAGQIVPQALKLMFCRYRQFMHSDLLNEFAMHDKVQQIETVVAMLVNCNSQEDARRDSLKLLLNAFKCKTMHRTLAAIPLPKKKNRLSPSDLADLANMLSSLDEKSAMDYLRDKVDLLAMAQGVQRKITNRTTRFLSNDAIDKWMIEDRKKRKVGFEEAYKKMTDLA